MPEVLHGAYKLWINNYMETIVKLSSCRQMIHARCNTSTQVIVRGFFSTLADALEVPIYIAVGMWNVGAWVEK